MNATVNMPHILPYTQTKMHEINAHANNVQILSVCSNIMSGHETLMLFKGHNYVI